jgi:hypothetical protein
LYGDEDALESIQEVQSEEGERYAQAVTPRRVYREELPVKMHFEVYAEFLEGGAPPSPPIGPPPVSSPPDSPEGPGKRRGAITPGSGDGPPKEREDAPDPEKQLCVCSCCRFLQIIDLHELCLWPGRDKQPTGKGDCQSFGPGQRLTDEAPKPWVDCSAPLSGVGRGSFDGSQPYPFDREYVECMGNRGPARGREKREYEYYLSQTNFLGIKTWGEGKYGYDRAAGCVYRGLDEPSIAHDRAGPNMAWTWDWLSIGLIIDSCNGGAIKAMCYFSYKDAGVLTEMSPPRILYDPGMWLWSNCDRPDPVTQAKVLARMDQYQKLAREFHDLYGSYMLPEDKLARGLDGR